MFYAFVSVIYLREVRHDLLLVLVSVSNLKRLFAG